MYYDYQLCCAILYCAMYYDSRTSAPFFSSSRGNFFSMRDGDVRERDASVDGDVDVYLRLGRRLFHLDERGGYEMRADENRASRLRGYPTVGEPHAESLARFEFRPEHVRRRDARAKAD